MLKKSIFKKSGIYFAILVLLFSLSFAEAKTGTCLNPKGGNYCNQKSQASDCYCDNSCVTYGDCCDDYKQTCAAQSTFAQSTFCPLYTCPIQPEGCHYEPGKDGNGCPTCGKLVCDKCAAEGQTCSGIHGITCCSGLHCLGTKGLPGGETCVKDKVECNSDSDCPQPDCFKAPCPKNVCIEGKCVLSTCGNGICETCENTCCSTCTGESCLNNCRGYCHQDCQSNIVCGNGICESGEAGSCPSCIYSNPPCLIACQAGTCPQDCKNGTIVSEQVTCIFSNTKINVNTCYSSKGDQCSGASSCTVKVSGTKNEKITWKSSCGGYAYTIIDGIDEKAVFSCNAQQTCKDSDDGINYYIKGIATTCPSVGDGPCDYSTDKCLSDSGNDNNGVHANILQEYYCDDSNQIKSVSYECPNGCKDGACMKKNQITKEDVIGWIKTNCKDSISPPPVVENQKSSGLPVTANAVSKIFVNKEYWKD